MPISVYFPRSISMGIHIHVHTGTYTLQAGRQTVAVALRVTDVTLYKYRG